MNMTHKQLQIMTVVMKGNVDQDGVTVSWCDVQQIMERVPYSSSREAVMCSLGFLEKKGMVEIKRRAEVRNGRRKTLYLPTNRAFDQLVRNPSEFGHLLDANF